MKQLGPRSLRGRTILYFGLGSLLVTGVFAASTYFLARTYLLHQRTDTLERRAAFDARVVAARLSTSGTEVNDILDGLDPLSGSAVLIRKDGDWYSSSLDMGEESVPGGLAALVSAGRPGLQIINGAAGPMAVIGIPMPSARADIYEVAPLDELAGGLSNLLGVLGIGVIVATAAAVGIAVWSSRRLLEPLDDLAGAAAEIAGGALSRRLDVTDDPDLVTLVGSFNSMVDALQARIERDARFAADVSHELRTPLTSLLGSVGLLVARRADFPARQQQALDIAVEELARFRKLLDDLIELARFDASIGEHSATEIDVHRLLAESLAASGRSTSLVPEGPGPLVFADKRRLERVVVNLADNADRYGGGLVGVSVGVTEGSVVVFIDDAGPGVPMADSERIFARFATGGGGRGSTKGTGLGLAIVRESVASLGGQVWVTSRPGGGARFVLRLPLAEGER